MSLSAAGQVPAALAEKFTDEILGRSRLVPTCHTWHTDGALYIGTSAGILLYFSIHHGKLEPLPLELKDLDEENRENSGRAILEILSSKEGVVFLDSNGNVRITQMSAPTETQNNKTCTLKELFLRIWGCPLNDRWFGLTKYWKLISYCPDGAMDRVLLNRDELAPYVAVEKFLDGCMVTLQDQGMA